MSNYHGNRKYTEGQVVGPYTIIGYNRRGWITCKCNKCGLIHDVPSSNVAKNTMCKNCRATFNTKPKRDLTGMRFGRLTVIESKLNNKNRTAWLCECDCGNHVTVSTTHLNSGHTKSCGCYMIDRTKETNSHDLRGLKFGKLTVIERTEGHLVPGGQLLTEYLCRCDCGNYLPVLSMNLVSGNTRSCGCLGLSAGEYELETLFNQLGVDYIKEYYFDDLRSSNGGLLRFDFAIMNEDDEILCLVEFNGEQHYYEDKYNKMFGKQQRDETDGLKREYCKKNNIKLFEIRFDDDIQLAVEKIIKYRDNS